MSIFCPSCGSELSDDSKFCPNCGTKIEAPVSQAVQATAETVENKAEEVIENVTDTIAETVTPEPQASEPVYQTPVYSQPYQQTVVNDQPVQGESKVLAIISMILGILSLVCCCWFGFFGIIVSVAGIAVGIIALATKKGGKGMAVAGIICSAIGLILAIITTSLSASLAGMSTDDVYDMFSSLGIDI